MAAVDWFATEVAAPPLRPPRQRAVAHRRRARGNRGRRLTGGILWIAAFAVLLAGVVALNVAVLRANMAVDGLSREQLELQAETATLASQVSSAASSIRIEQTARRLGLVPAPATDTSYLNVGRR